MRWGALLASSILVSAAAAAADGPRIVEHTVPWPDTRPRDPYVAPDGRVWFVGQTGNYLAVFDPESGEFSRHGLPEGTRPHTVIVDDDGIPWAAGNGNGTLLRFDPEAGGFDVIALPEQPGLYRKDPHTMAFDGRGGIWFTMQQGNAIGRFDIGTREFSIRKVATANALPYGIVTTPAGKPWIVLLGTNALATLPAEGGEVREVRLPREPARPRRLGLDPAGDVWYVDYAEGWLGRYRPHSGEFDEWRAPSGDSGPYAMGVDPAGRVWFFETSVAPNRLVGFDPASGSYRWASEVPSGGGTVRHMSFDAGRKGFWFGTDTNKLGFFAVPD